MARVPGPSGMRHLYYLRRQIQNYAEALIELQREYGDVARIRLPDKYLCFFHPRHIKHVLRDNVLNYPKSRKYDMLRPLLGSGIFVSDGQLWAQQRRLVAPEFRENAVARFVPVMVECAHALFAEWDDQLGPEKAIDVSSDMMKLTLWIVGGALFKSDFRDEAEVIGNALKTCLEHATLRMLSMGLYQSWLPTPGNFQAMRAEQKLNRVVMNIIQRGRQGDLGSYDVLSRMIRATDEETGARMTDQQLLDEAKSLILAGHETTSLALSWAFYLLAQHPESEERLAREAWRVLGDRIPTATDIGGLSYARMVLLETLRLYPPVPAVSRNVLAADDVDGIQVRPDEMVVIAPYVTHRHPEFWPRPSAFDPERFSEERAKEIEPYSYLPFLLGRRACLGEHFALLEGTLMLAMITRRYQLALATPPPIPTKPISTLRLARPLLMRVRWRQLVQ